jgi:ubiquinone/menaquinone biosynthesis C-methylase UbiE
MDLHDYKDVAENYDRYLDVMYNQEFDKHEGFQEFYLELAKKYGKDGVIDVACGTGAVLLYLAEHGVLADGTDLSEEMCRVCEKKARDKNLDLRIFAGNMTDFDAGRKYSLVIIARSGFMHLSDQKSQIAALENLGRHLVSGGILTLNTFDPWPQVQAEQINTKLDDYSFRLEYVNSEGQREKIYNAISYNPWTQIMSGNWKFETYDDKGNIIEERIRPLTMRQTYRWEMFLLAKLCGFEVLDIYRGYKGDKEDLNDPMSAAKYQSNLIWILRKK